MKKQIFQKFKLLAIFLGILLLLPPDTSFNPNSEFYIARNPSNNHEEHLFKISLSNSKQFPIGSEKLTAYLSKLNSSRHGALIAEIERLFEKLSPSQAKERLRLLQIAHRAGQISQSGRINQVLIDQAEKYSNSNQPTESEISRLALEFYMELEIDSQMKRSQINRVISAIIHIKAPPEKNPCSRPDFYLSKPECEKKSRQPCQLAVLAYENQANACWKPLISESKIPRNELYSNESKNNKKCRIFTLDLHNDLQKENTHLTPISRKCRLNYFHSLLDFEPFSITYGTDCQKCTDTLISDIKTQDSPIQALFQQMSQEKMTWIPNSCQGNPSWNHEFQNGHNFSIEAIDVKDEDKSYFGFKMDQCSVELSRTRTSTYYF